LNSDDREQEVAALLEQNERALLDPAVRRDRERVLALLAEDFEEFGASGRVWTRDEVVDLLANEAYDPPVMSDFRCRMITPLVALVTYRTQHTHAMTGACTAVNRSSIWVEEEGSWRIRFHQGTPAERAPVRPG